MAGVPEAGRGSGGGAPLPDAEGIVETVREALLVLDGTLWVRRANRSFYQTFRVEPADTEGRPLYDLGNGQWDIPALRTLLEDILPQNTSFHGYEVAHVFPSIGRKVMLLNARRIYREGNHAESILLAIEDITERRKAEDALAVQQAWHRAILRSIGDAVIATDEAGRVTFMNPVAGDLTGWTTEEATGVPLERVFRIVNEETRHTVENPVTKALREGAVVGLANHTVLIQKSGGERSIDDSAAPIQDSSGRVIGVVLIFRDVTERRGNERAVREALEYAENIVETVREPLVVLDGQLRVRTANRSFYQTFRVTPGETENCLLYDLGNGQWDIPALRTLLERILPQNSTFQDYEVTHDFPGIGRKAMLLNARRMYRAGNQTELILLAVEDVTERRRLEDERRELETRFASLVKNIRDHSIFTLDPQGQITSWNVEAERILGYTEAEALGQNFSIIFTAEDREAGVPARELKTALSEGRAEDERWHLRKNGERFWALGIVSPTHDATGRHTGYSKILRDMTDRKQAEEGTRKTQEIFKLVHQIAKIGHWEWNSLTDENKWSPEIQALYGLEPGTFDGTYDAWAKLLHPDDLPRAEEDVRRALETGRYFTEFRVVWPDGSVHWLEARANVFKDGHDKPVRIMGVNMDITERKEMEEALRLADRRKDEFLATLAHELRNPLAPIRNGLQIIRLTPDRAAREQAREMMERQLGQMVRLVDDLLDISRISRNKLEMRKARIDLWGVVQSAIETARPQVEARGHTLTVTLPPKPVYLDGDLTRLAQVFWNLLNNAAKYTEPGGRISLTAELHGGEAVVSVQDNGIGIPAESLPGLFEMFSQVDRSLERAEGGLGIGLALVKGLTEAHGGSVEVRSEGVGHGSTFVVRLPVAQGDARPEKQQSHEVGKPGPKRRILVVDDNRDGAASLAMLLTLMGNDTRTAHDGLEGVELAEAFRPDLIVLDIGLPKMNGYETCRRIREKPWAKDTLIIAATGWGQDENRRRSKDAGFDHHLVKPVDAAEVVRLLAKGRP